MGTLNRRAFLALLMLVLAGVVSAQLVTTRGVLRKPAAAGGGGYTYVYQTDFETSGAPSGWTAYGTIGWNYSTAPAPLVGTNSLSFGGDGNEAIYYNAAVDYSEVWCYLLVDLNNAGSASFFQLRSGGDPGSEFLRVRYIVGELTINDRIDADATTTGGTMPASGTVHIWVHYRAGSGANGVLEAWWSSTSTRTTDAAHHCIKSDSTRTVNVNEYELCVLNITGGNVVFDKFRVSTSEIGNDPN